MICFKRCIDYNIYVLFVYVDVDHQVSLPYAVEYSRSVAAHAMRSRLSSSSILIFPFLFLSVCVLYRSFIHGKCQ